MIKRERFQPASGEKKNIPIAYARGEMEGRGEKIQPYLSFSSTYRAKKKKRREKSADFHPAPSWSREKGGTRSFSRSSTLSYRICALKRENPETRSLLAIVKRVSPLLCLFARSRSGNEKGKKGPSVPRWI